MGLKYFLIALSTMTSLISTTVSATGMEDEDSKVTKRYITWPEIDTLSDQLEVGLACKTFKGILVITRGGLTPSGLLAQRLSTHTLPKRIFETLCLKSYDDLTNQRKAIEALKSPELENGGEDWLVVDDISDSGETFKFVRGLFPRAQYLAYFVKPAGLEVTDFFGEEVAQDTWIVFPWEPK